MVRNAADASPSGDEVTIDVQADQPDRFDAEDVAWNLERIGGLYADRLKIPLSSFQRASMVANITKAQAVDKDTVKVTLSRPNNAFFAGSNSRKLFILIRVFC